MIMMENPEVIDITCIDEETDKLILIMTEHRPWNGKPMCKQFHEKANAYAHYVLSEQLAEDWPNRSPKDVVVQLVCAYAPDSTTLAFIDEIKAGLFRLGIGFTYEVRGPCE
jgi:hypothetical protein